MKNQICRWLCISEFMFAAFAHYVFAQTSGVICSQTSSSNSSNIVFYDTSTGETSLLTTFAQTDQGRILTISSYGSGRLIYFTRSSPANGRPNPTIWRMNFDGSGLTDFLSPDTEVSYTGVAVSPDGNTIAYTANDRDNPSVYQLYICNSDGTNRRRLTFDPGWNCSYPSFIDNSTILLKMQNGYLENYYTVTTAGVLTNLTNNESLSPYFPRLGRPMLNAARNAIVYAKQVQEIAGYRKWEIYQLMSLDGTGKEKLITDFLYFAETNPLLQEEPYPAYGETDTAIFFCGTLAGNVYDLYTVNIPVVNPYSERLTSGALHTTLPVFVTTSPQLQRYVYSQAGYVYVRNENGNATRITAGSGNRHPAINRRGTLVAFVSASGLYVVRPDGTGIVQIDPNSSVDYPEFSPDGLWLLYVKNGDIYAKRSDGSGSSIRLTFTGNVIGDISFSPLAQEIAFTATVNGKKNIFVSPVQISYGAPMSITIGAPRNITPLTYENYSPSWAPDGNTIVFISTRNQLPEVWLMKRDGSQQRKVLFATNNPVNPSSACFSADNSNIIYYLSGNPQLICRADISQQNITPVITQIGAEHLRVSNAPADVVEAERIMSITERDPYISFTYYLILHVDRIPLPGSAILTEVIPDNWQLFDAKINGYTPSPLTSNGATTGTLKWLFGPSGIAPLQDSVVQITIKTTNPASEIYGNFRVFSSWCDTYGIKTFTKGSSSIKITNPHLPFDTNSDWQVSDEELLKIIYLWSINGRISGWPENLNDWDTWLLTTIDLWANQAGYTYDMTNSRLQGTYLWKRI
ncbi:MAG: DPP IV N-terminal domain-containing protein [Candidatus Ratteibacteria bacterium]